MVCLNLNIPQVKKDFDELKRIFNSENIAYALLSQNNGYTLDLTPQGTPSKLYNSLLQLEGIDGNTEEALKTKAKVYTSSFIATFGDWLNNYSEFNTDVDQNGEPSVNLSIFDSYRKPITKQEAKLQAKAVTFLTNLGKSNVSEILEESLYNVEDTKKWKDLKKVKSLLEKSNKDFVENGLFIYKQDKYISYLNANLFEELLDEQRLVERINEKTREQRELNKLTPHNTISSKLHEGKRWVVTTDSKYSQEKDYDTQQRRRQGIINRNRQRLADVNDKFIRTTGMSVISGEDAVDKQGMSHTIVTINEEALKEYNSVMYTNYLNNMKTYLDKNNTHIDEDFTLAPLTKKLKSEEKQVRQQKNNLESKGGKQSEVNRLDNKLKDIQERLKNLKNEVTLSDIYDEAELQLKEVNDLLKQPKLTEGEIYSALTKMKIWLTAGDFSEDTHIFLDEEQIESEEIRTKFYQIKSRAEDVTRKILDKGKGVVSNMVSSAFGQELKYEDVVKLTHKLGIFNQGLSLNRVGHALSQFIAKIVNQANDSAFREVKTSSRDLAELHDKAKSSGFDDRDFYQITDVTIEGVTEEIPTGRLIHKFSDMFFKERGKNSNSVWFRKNKLLTLNPELLFETTGEEHAKHIQEIVFNLGELEAKKYIARAEKKWNDFNAILEEHISIEYGTEELTKEQKADLVNWKLNNSPIERIKLINKYTGKKLNEVPGKDTFLEIVPKRLDNKKRETGFYDKYFYKIESNLLAYEFYQKAEEITNNAQKIYGKGDFTSTSLAYIEMSVWEKLSKIGVGNFLSKNMYDEIVTSFAGGTPIKATIDPVTGKPIKQLQYGTSSIDSRIKDLVTEKKKNFILTSGEEPNEIDKKRILVEASKEVFNSIKFNENTTSLFQSLNILNMSATTFRHLSMIEDQVNLAMTYLPNSTVNTGDDIIDEKGNPVGQKYIDQLQATVEHHLDVLYYKTPKGDTSGIIGHLRTTEQKKVAKGLSAKLKNPEITEEEKKVIDGQLEELGVKVTTNSLVRRLMDFLRLKSLGWNVSASLVNLAWGTITNMYKGAEGRMFNLSDWVKAEKEILTNWNKFNKVVENYNVIGDILYEYKNENKFHSKENWFFKLIKAVKPYAMQTGVEKKNQGTTMIAMLIHQKVTNNKREEKSLWEVIDDNGKLSDEWGFKGKKGYEAVTEAVNSIKNTVQEVHADFTNPLMIEKSILGKALTMFRKWIFESIHSRFGYEKMDYNRNIVLKGRYRTAWELGKQFYFNPIKLYQAYKNKELSDVDAANIRGNIAEMMTMLGTMLFGSLLKNGICGDSSSCKCKDANIYQLTVLNIYQKLEQDTNFYRSPTAWANFIGSPTAMTSYLIDSGKLIDLIYTGMFGEEEDMIYQSGPNKDRYKLDVFINTQIPIVNQTERAKKYSSELLNLNW
jgi:hypothetical protein